MNFSTLSFSSHGSRPNFYSTGSGSSHSVFFSKRAGRNQEIVKGSPSDMFFDKRAVESAMPSSKYKKDDWQANQVANGGERHYANGMREILPLGGVPVWTFNQQIDSMKRMPLPMRNGLKGLKRLLVDVPANLLATAGNAYAAWIKKNEEPGSRLMFPPLIGFSSILSLLAIVYQKGMQWLKTHHIKQPLSRAVPLSFRIT